MFDNNNRNKYSFTLVSLTYGAYACVTGEIATVCVRMCLWVNSWVRSCQMNQSICILSGSELCELRYIMLSNFSQWRFHIWQPIVMRIFYICIHTHTVAATSCWCCCGVVVNGFEIILIVENSYKYIHRAHKHTKALFNREQAMLVHSDGIAYNLDGCCYFDSILFMLSVCVYLRVNTHKI